MNLRKSLDTCLDMKKLCSHIFSENGGEGSRNREKKRKLIERRWPKTFHKFWIIHGMVQHILFCTYHNGVEPEISEKNDPNQNCPNYYVHTYLKK